MHLLVRENRTLDEQEVAEDLNLPSADLVVLSFTESDLLALRHAEALLRAQTEGGVLLPTLQVTSLARLRHPMSIDLYIETTLQKARCVVVRLLGGLDYWRYGAEELAAWSRETGVPLVLLPGDTLQSHSSDVQQQAAHTGDDVRLAELSTVSAEHYARLNGFFQQGGPDNICAALALMSALAGMQEDKGTRPKALPAWGVYRSYSPAAALAQIQIKAVILLYRAHLLVGDVAGPECLAEELAQRGCTVDIVYVTSLKDPSVSKDVSLYLQSAKPDVILDATCFPYEARMVFHHWMWLMHPFCNFCSRDAHRLCGQKAHAVWRGQIWPCKWYCQNLMAQLQLFQFLSERTLSPDSLRLENPINRA